MLRDESRKKARDGLPDTSVLPKGDYRYPSYWFNFVSL
jgi:hypothetical protein